MLSQHVGQELTVESGADRLDGAAVPRGPFEDRVGRHDAGGMGGKGPKEGTDVIIQIMAGEGSETSVVGVTVPAVLGGAVADPVLDHRYDAGRVHTA